MIRAVANGFVMKHFFNDVQSLHCKCNTFSAFRQRTILSSQWVSCVPLAQWIARWTSNPKVLGSTPRWDDPSFSRSSKEKISDLVPKFSKVQLRPPPPCVPTHRTTSQAEPQQKTKTCLHIIPGLVAAQILKSSMSLH